MTRLDPDVLLGRLRPVLARLDADLHARTADPGVQQALAAEHKRELVARRTADPLEVWIRFRVTQIAAAWVLSLLFVRTLEDRDLVPHRLKASDDHRTQLRALAPYLNDRDYLLLVFRELTRYRGVRDVFDEHNPVWTLGPSAEVAAELLAFAKSEQGLGGLDFSGDTRFLGDVYEQLDEGVRKRFALLQTPDFVEAFILDRTLTPALAERGVDGLTLIDPTCGSGHFLLGAFERLRQAQQQADPAGGPETWAFKAIHQVFGADINPYAVAIARFRLVLAYVDAAEVRDLDEAGDLRLNLAVADSLLPVEGAEQQQLASAVAPEQRAAWGANPFAFAQGADAQRVLGGRTFDVVVGNPPYITVKDKALRQAYRDLYTSAHREYQLVVPFVERFFGLASAEGWVGAIVGNGFMKRLFGQKIIEAYLPTVDLTQIVDTSGAFIPGHGTPTVLLFGRHRSPSSDDVLAVMGKRGEPTTPGDPANGEVWSSIRDHAEDVGFENDYLSVDTVERENLSKHPWSLKGGGATKLKKSLEDRSTSMLGDLADSIGFMCITKQDEVFAYPANVLRRYGLEPARLRQYVPGQDVRDWSHSPNMECIYPYDDNVQTVLIEDYPGMLRAIYPWKRVLEDRKVFGGLNYKQAGKCWWEYGQIPVDRLKIPLSLAFAFVATHNHFVLDRGGKVFNRSAPIIKLPPEATEDDHLALLGYLNSSTACFWMKQVFFCKGAQGVNEGLKSAAWMQFYEHDGTKIKQFPLLSLKNDRVTSLARRLDGLARRRLEDTPSAVIQRTLGDSASLRQALQLRRDRDLQLLRQMVGLQEGLDWYVYSLYGLCPAEQVREPVPRDPYLRVSDRAVLKRALAGEDDAEAWFRIHGWDLEVVTAAAQSTPLDQVDRQRLELMTQDRFIGLLESPRFKRRWYAPDHRKEELSALRTWLLDRVEAEVSSATNTRTVRQLARTLNRDPKVLAVAEVYADQPEPDLERLLTELVKGDAVPYLAAHRYKTKGLEKYHAWERTWAAQRREDAGETVEVPLPPKYGSGDFARTEYWRLRGKLDVPKERFIAYPGLEDEDDPTPVLGWAGWDHADRIAALGALVENEADPDKKLPLLAGMLELLPWVEQWHGDDARYGTPMGEMWRSHLEGLRTALHLSEDDLKAWRPAKKSRGRKAKGSGGRRKKVSLARGDLLEAFDALHEDGAEGVARKALAERLGVSGAALGRAATGLLDEGVWMVVKKRPIVYQRRGDE